LIIQTVVPHLRGDDEKMNVIPSEVEESVEKGNRCLDYTQQDEKNTGRVCLSNTKKLFPNI
jgi:hypothetical protein